MMATALSTNKRKHQSTNLEMKLKIIAELAKGKSQRLVSEIFQIPKSTVNDIWKQREKIQQFITSCVNPTSVKKRCIVKQLLFPEHDQACHLWFMQQRSKGAPVSGPILQEKSLQLFPKLYPQLDLGSFKASSGWLQKFCHRHGIRAVKLQGEMLSAYTSMIEPFRRDLQCLIEKGGYTRDHIFNAGVTGLWWKLMPSRSLVSSGETNAKNFKQSKDRVTLLGCPNASGTCKFPLAFIHKSARPRCYKHIDMETLPVSYFAQRKSWMDAKLFLQWFELKFLPT